MAHICQELGLVAAGYFKLTTLLFDLAEEARVLDSQDGLRRKCLEEVHRFRAERPRLTATHYQCANNLFLAQERNGQERAKPCLLDRGAYGADRTGQLLAPKIGRLHGGSFNSRLSKQRLAQANVGVTERLDQLGAHAVAHPRLKLLHIFVELVDCSSVGAG